MWWRLGILAAITTALLFVLPLATVTFRVALPPGAHSGSTVEVPVVAIIILVIAGWIGWRIVRRHRISN